MAEALREEMVSDLDLVRAAEALLAAAKEKNLREKLRMVAFALHVLGSQP